MEQSSVLSEKIDCPVARQQSVTFRSNTRTKHTTGKSKPKLVSGPIVRVIHQSIAKRRHFGNFNFYKVLYGKPCPFSLFAIQNLIKYTISNWWHFVILWCTSLTIGSLTNFGLLFPVVCFVAVSGQALYELSYPRDKGLLHMIVKLACT